MNQWILAAVFGAVAFFAGIGPALEGGSLTATTLLAAVSAAGMAFIGKVMDPNAVIALPPGATAFLFGLVTVAPMVGNIFTDGTYANPMAWGNIAVAFITVVWGKWSVPSSAFTLGVRLSPQARALRLIQQQG